MDTLVRPQFAEYLEWRSHYTVEEYLFNCCFIFALALHNVYRYRMEFFWDESASGPSDGSRIRHIKHAYCIRKDGTLVDARGTVTREEIQADYGGSVNQPNIVEVTKAELLELFAKGTLETPGTAEVGAVQTFIRSNPDVYKLGQRTILPATKLGRDEMQRLYDAIPPSDLEYLRGDGA